MNAANYNRSIPLNCPTCGSTEFGSDHEEASLVTCQSCGKTLTRDELVDENGENIAEHVNEVKAQVLKDVTEELRNTIKKAFKGNKNIRFK